MPDVKTILMNRLKANGPYGLLRKHMDKDELRIIKELLKDGLVVKGVSDDKQKTVCYFWNG
jgi:hypothetical protein